MTLNVEANGITRNQVIMDEVGRGTTVSDGLAIAFATVHHLVTVNRCRALFATHFHELADLLGCCGDDNRGSEVFRNVALWCTDVDETEVSFIRRRMDIGN
jgi:DNA mismatch repair ATPase MutS